MAVGGKVPTVEAVHTVSLFHEYCALSKLRFKWVEYIFTEHTKFRGFVSCLAAS